MTAYIPVLAAIIGALVYVLAGHPKAAEMGRLLFAAGVLAFLLALAGKSVRLLG